MTLAEIFLLLLIVGWYGMRLESENASLEPPAPEAVLREDLRRAEEAAERAENARRELEARVTEHERILVWLQQHYGGGPIADFDTLKKLIAAREDRIRNEARRGKPVCAAANVLVRAVVDNGAVGLVLLEDFEHEKYRVPKNTGLDEGSALNDFLAVVQGVYAARRQAGADCVYDYELRWRTDTDYRVARQRFERYFYPARVTQLQ